MSGILTGGRDGQFSEGEKRGGKEGIQLDWVKVYAKIIYKD